VRRLATIVAVLIAAGCGSTVPSNIAPSATTPALVGTASAQAPSTSSASSPPRATLASPIPVEQGLVDLLPASVDGLDRQSDASVDAGIARDPDLAAIARSFATALYVNPPSGEFAYVSLVRLSRPLENEAYRDYRDSFDQAACAQAGGRTGTATGTLGGRSVDIGHCAGGLLTYHLSLDGPIVVSISSLGDRRLGERIIGALGDPTPS
jgi:hypothetical protein